jgi:cullin 1
MRSNLQPLPDKENPDETWKFLQDGVNKIMTKLQEGMDMTAYMELYTAVHNFCTAQKPVGSGGFNSVNNNRGGAHLLGEGLYNRLQSFLNTHLDEVKSASDKYSGEDLLKFYIKEWQRYTTAATYNNHLFRYLNRHWVKREMDEGKKNVYDIYTLHLVRWKAVMFTATHDKVMKAVLELVEKQRNGDTIEHQQVKQLVMSFVALGLDESDSTKSTLDVYKEFFEIPYLRATKEYYAKESKNFLAENSVVEYMKKAESRIQEEKERVDMYLLNDILSPLMRTCDESLIKDHSNILREEFQVLLDTDRQDDLGRMYRLLQRITDGLDPLKSRFELHVKKSGFNAVEKIITGSENVDPKVYVETLLEVHIQYRDLVVRAFDNDTEFVRSLDNACRDYVNRNKISKSNLNKSPELLAKFTDNLLKQNTKMSEDNDMEKSQTNIMTIFKYIEDKDVYQNFYRRALAKRLVNSSASDDAETGMISKLKEACGFEYTNKLQRMFQDIQTSKDLNSSYREWVSNTYNADDQKQFVDASYNILATGVWPLTAPNTNFAPPPILQKTYERFSAFYASKHSGRKLTWLWQLCKGEVKANYTKAMAKLPYTFQVSSYQMAILLLFNEADSLTYEQIEEATKLNKDHLEPCLAVFLKAKVFNVIPEGSKPEPGTKYTLNHNFKSKKIKVNLNINIKAETKQETEETHKTIEDDRKLLIQSAIVRVMKSRKTLKHQNLVSETISLIRSRFTPKVSDIKKCIEMLIEKEYLERLEDDVLGYLA